MPRLNEPCPLQHAVRFHQAAVQPPPTTTRLLPDRYSCIAAGAATTCELKAAVLLCQPPPNAILLHEGVPSPSPHPPYLVNIFPHADITRTGNTPKFILSTLASSTGILVALLG
ncbi:hypothetical protein GALMADRAFT_136352 [Galerina marginata CBS 339.88]|uniref:Uncharacterized protein n=1 Tax=Galerina marginata (strain CBS 339.88) TaxID=685588 RepID=A0A067T9B4_GALM3|nr:hypothetical protein GALMADRAFT_136352 [Galerina marginata CBS 339.88]